MKCCLFLWLVACFSAAAEPRVIRDIEFAVVDGDSLQLDLYLPAGTTHPPLVVWIHGGGWEKGSRKDCKVSWMTGHGYAVAGISYRLTDRAIFPAQIHDCKGALRWLRAHADTYGYSVKKVGVAGASAGGMLAALMATSGGVKELEGEVGGNRGQSSRVDAAIDFYGATDFVLRSKTQPKRANEPGSVVFKLLGGGADTRVALAKLASAALHVSPDDPPMMVWHGDGDKTVLIDQSERIHRAYTEAKRPIEFIVLSGAGHGGDPFFTAQNKQRMIGFFDKWLKSR